MASVQLSYVPPWAVQVTRNQAGEKLPYPASLLLTAWHITHLSGELSHFFNAVLPVASSEQQAGTCEMDVQPPIPARGQPALPHPTRGWAQRSLCAENSSSEPHKVAMLSSSPAQSHLACSESTQRCRRALAQLGKSAFKQDSLTLIAYGSDIISESSSQKCILVWCKSSSSSMLIIKEW